MAYERQHGEGNVPLIHMSLLAHAPERVLALRLALSSVVQPSSSVLDAGCGSLGILAIMAAKLGARHVVGVDFGRLGVARALAQENGVADRVRFVECDLADLDDSIGTFDVIVGMIYNNDPKRDLPQQQLMSALVQRFGHADTAIIPDTVRYTVAAYDSTTSDTTGYTRQGDWEDNIRRVEGQTGVTFSVARRLVDREWWSRLGRDVPWLSQGSLTARFGYPDRRSLRLLTARELFTQIDYTNPRTASTYPPSVTLPVSQPGRVDTTIWCQDLMFGDQLIRSTETTYPAAPHADVQPGDAAILSTGVEWGEALPLTLRRGSRAE